MTARRVDANQKQIVKEFRNIGMSVLISSDLGKGAPDIIVGTHGMNFLFEIKDGEKPLSAQKLTGPEYDFFNSWRGQVAIIRCVKDVHLFADSLRRRFNF
jgi:hypothetical protein